MRSKPLLMLLVAASIGVLAAGCGSSSNTSTSPTAANTSSATATTSSSVTPGSATLAAAVSKCKSVVQSRAPANLRSKLMTICDKAGSGNPAALKQALGQVCTQIVNTSVPGSAPKSLKETALTECKKAFG